MRVYIFLICALIFKMNNLQCGNEDIEYCAECHTDINSCKRCEKNYFLFFNNSLCIPCNDSIYGQFGNIKCNRTCEEGYYNLNNICRPCSDGLENCGKCTYEPPSFYISNDFNLEYFICTECISNQYKLNKGQCKKCQISNCNECYYKGDETICDKCNTGYYKKDNQCSKCSWNNVSEGKICEICSDNLTNYEEKSCYCMTHYTEGNSKECIKCPNNCYSCEYKNNISKCSKCEIGYTLNSEGICVSCGENCDYCELDINGNPLCLFCKENYKLNENHNCLECDNNCESCIKDKDDTIKCSKCEYKYGLYPNNTCGKCPENCNNCFWKEEIGEFGCSDCANPFDIIGKDDKCISCQNIDEIGGNGCAYCYYDNISLDNNKYKCTRCSGDNFTFIENQNKCLDNTNSYNEYLNGCINATYNTEKNKYECNQCKLFYIYISNEKKCLEQKNTNLGFGCSKAINIGTQENPIYTCINCLVDELVKIKDTQNITYCGFSENLINCLEATKDENGKIECTKCNYNLDLYYDKKHNQTICSKLCEDDSFFLYSSCFKCDDILYGNPGCLSESKCSIDAYNNQIDCNECKEGYYESFEGCLHCSMKNLGCKKCNYFKCDECFDGYTLNSSNLCELKKCEEYPEISPGCLICKDKLNEYISESKCEACKEGFFKTKEKTCIYCKSNTYGGHGCEQCDYFDDKINCSYCPEGSVLDNNRKCLKCEEELGEGCSNCKYILNEEDKSNKLICTECDLGYFLSSNGHCIYQNYEPDIPNCDKVDTRINLINFINLDNLNINLYNDFEISHDNNEIQYICLSCKEGYYNMEGECIKLNIDNCTFSLIISNYSKYNICYDYFCKNDKFATIYYKIDKQNEIINTNSNDPINIINSQNIFNLCNLNYYLSFKREDIFNSLNKNSYMCIGNLGNGGKDNPEELKYCKTALYNKENDDYECIECLSEYILDEETKRCVQKIKYINEHSGLNCDFENIGKPNEPLYSCKNCYNQDDILVKSESGAKFCINSYEIEGCTEANVKTDYITNIYDCTKCSQNYILYKLYDRNICQNIDLPIKKTNNYSCINYSEIEKESAKAENGECKNQKFFTPDNINCYACNSKNVGIPGCNGACTFSLKRENPLECEDGCKKGYIEIKKGICDKCNNVNKGCIECHYDNNYPIYFKGIKRKRRFVCDICEKGYILSADFSCQNYSDFGINNCEQYKWDENINNELICSQCEPGYFISENGKCKTCNGTKVRVKENKCVACNDREYGGIEGCILCKSDNINIIECEKCDKGYILYDKNKTCIKVSNNIEFQNYPNCQTLTTNNNKLECSSCNINYSILSENNEEVCIPSDVILTKNVEFNKYCEKFINKGTLDKPIYSCDKCIDYNFFNFENINMIKFTFKSNGTSFCNLNNDHNNIGMCKEATIIEKQNDIEYNCTKCYEGNYLYNKKANLFYCKNNNELHNDCKVKNCNECQKNNNNFCEICNQPYEPDSITGLCTKNFKKVPSIIWKAIYGLKMNQSQLINQKIYYGPSLVLVGITSSQIIKGHAFSFYLSTEFKNINRNLQNVELIKKVPMICQTEDDFDESENDINMVEYNCIGNITQSENEKLSLENSDIFKIEEDIIKNNGTLMPSNLNDMELSKIKEENRMSQFSLDQFSKTSIFTLDEIKNQTSKSQHFIFTLNGKLKGYTKELNEINEKLDIFYNGKNTNKNCNLNIPSGESGLINCDIILEGYPNNAIFSFKFDNYKYYQNNLVEFSQINNIYLISDYEKSNEKEGFFLMKINIKKLLPYIIYIAGGIAFIIIIISIIICCIKKKPKKMIRNFNVRFRPNAVKTKSYKIHKKISIKNNKPTKNQLKKVKNNSKTTNKSKELKINDSSKRKMFPSNQKKNIKIY